MKLVPAPYTAHADSTKRLTAGINQRHSLPSGETHQPASLQPNDLKRSYQNSSPSIHPTGEHIQNTTSTECIQQAVLQQDAYLKKTSCCYAKYTYM